MADKSDDTRRRRSRLMPDPEVNDDMSDASDEQPKPRSTRSKNRENKIDTDSNSDYRLRRDHSKPLRYKVDLGYETGSRPKPDSPSKPVPNSPQKTPQKRTPAKAPEKVEKSPAPKKSGRRTPADRKSTRKENGNADGASPSPHKTRRVSLRPRNQAPTPPDEGPPTQAVVSPRAIQTPAEFTQPLKDNLKRLKNVLKLPKARRWVYCEFFYADIDRQLFLGDNEFSQCLRESFPNLKCRTLTRIEWRQIRQLIGKPRRCSQAFFDEERAALTHKRHKIREIHAGTMVSVDADLVDVPAKVMRPLTIGAKVYARVRSPKDGIYTGTVDAVLPDGYRIIFDKEEVLQPQIVKDTEIMSERLGDLVALGYFLEHNRAAMPVSTARASGQPYLSPSKVMTHERSPLLRYDPVLTASSSAAARSSAMTPRRSAAAAMMGRDEKVGNFPVRLLVMLVKLSKLIELKRNLVGQTSELNNQAERMNLLTDHYPFTFQEKYAQVIVDLETLNRQLGAYLNGVSEYHAVLLPQLTEVTVTSRPDALRKLCNTHAVQIVKHCNNGLNVQSRKCLDLVTSLTALLLQVRSLGQQSCNAFELSTLSQALSEIRCQVDKHNVGPFQDHVEVHMKQIHQMMLRSGKNDFPKV